MLTKKSVYSLVIVALVALVSPANAFWGKKETTKSKSEGTKMHAEEVKSKKEKNSNKSSSDTVVMNTEKGEFKIKLYLDKAPVTAGNFKDLVERKFYDGIIFHRIIPGFVVQGGCPHGNGTGGFIDPETKKERTVPMEKTSLRHTKPGIEAMARTQDPNSASSQFFIDLAPLPSLDPGGGDPYGYSIFGEVS